MQLQGRHIVVTGGAGGIGSALLRGFGAEGARALVIADRDRAGAEAVAGELQGAGTEVLAVELDAGREQSVQQLIAQATQAFGPIDIFVSNAGVGGAGGGPEALDEAWDEAWRVNVMAHVWASRALLPEMLERGEGYLINTASAAGLLTQVSSLIYSVTKHAAVALAEWLSIEYLERGVRVSCICPQGVRTRMLEEGMHEAAAKAALESGGLIEPDDVAAAVVAGIAEERFLILPHENVRGFMAFKGGDPERWLKGMRRLVREARAGDAAAQPAD